MNHIINEDSTIPDVGRQLAGIGTGASNPGDPGAMRAGDYINHQNELPISSNNKPYPIEAIDQTLADMVVQATNIQKMLDIAKENPAIKDNDRLEKLEKQLKKIAEMLLDFDNGLSIIKGNE